MPNGATYRQLPGVSHRSLQAGELHMHIAEAGQGPLVILLHGFPESWYSWRHQLIALAEAGFHVVAPDQRGYGRTGGPATAGQYSMLHLTGDVIALMDALGEQHAVLAGHDWGAPVAWNTALFRPDRIRGVIGLSVPYLPRGGSAPVAALRAGYGDGFYMVHFQQPGVAEAELGMDLPTTFRKLLYTLSGDYEAAAAVPVIPAGLGMLDVCADPAELPSWLTQQDIDFFVAEFAESGFTGPLNWYRNLDRNWELMAAWQHAPVVVPAQFIAGDKDMVISFLGGRPMIEALPAIVPKLAEPVLLPGCGHWTQQERPGAVTAAMLEFLSALG